MSDNFELRVLGTPRVVGPDGDPLDIPLGKPLAALCFIALETARVRRDDLADLLWSRAPRDRSRASVRQALWLLRRGLGDEIVREEDGALSLDPARMSTDLARLETLLSEDRLGEAWALWQGGPLEGFAIPDSPAWQRWADRVRGGWERRFGDALEVQAAREYGEARVTWLRRALEVRPYRESAHVALVETFIHERRVAEAEQALQHARTVVDDPDPNLFADLEERLGVLRRAAFEDAEDRLHFEFVGRAREFSALATAWSTVLTGRPRTVGVVGPAGIGKTRLADELVELARVDGALLAEVSGVDTERTIGFGALASLVRDLLHLPGAAGISAGSLQVLQGLVPSATRPGDDRVDLPAAAPLADAFLDLVESVAHEGPLILRLEDLHWIDPASRNLVLRTLRQLRGARVLLLCTCRTEEMDASALRVLDELEERGRAEVVGLGPLSRSEVAEMLGLMFRFAEPATARESAERLYEASGGNPLFLLELIRGLDDDGLIESQVEEDGSTVRVLRLPDELVLPASVREALDRRLAGLGQGARALAKQLADTARPLRPSQLTRRADMSESEGVSALGELLRRDLVRWTRDERLVLSHDFVRARVRSHGDPGETRGRAGLRRALVGILGVVAILAGLFLIPWGAGDSGAAASAGGGIIFLEENAALVGYRLRQGPDGELDLDSVMAFTAPEGIEFRGPPRRGEDGWVIPADGNPDLAREPDAWLLGQDTAWLVYATPGDDAVRQIWPDGRHLLLAVEDPDSSRFRMNVVRLRPDPLDPQMGDTTVLFAQGGNPRVSPDGRFVVVQVDRAVDSVAVLHPDGTLYDALEVPHGRMGGVSWCPPDHQVLGISTRDAAPPEFWLWTLGSEGGGPGAVRTLEFGTELVFSVVCSPDGRSYLLVTGGSAGQHLLLVDRESGETRGRWPLASRTGPLWVPDDPVAAPQAVDIALDSLSLRRGESRSLTVAVDPVGSGLEPERIRWASRDPLTVSVRPTGVVTANGPGRSWIVAEVDRWLRDSVRVEVVEEEGADTLFFDPLDDLDPPRWWFFGYPHPEPVSFRGQAVVSMRGDGSRTDGMISRESFSLDRGGTVEIDFHLRLTRPDQQAVRVCVIESEPDQRTEGDLATFDIWDDSPRICFAWPVDEFEDRDPGRARFTRVGSGMGPVVVEGVIQPDDWNRVSIQVRPDGWFSLFLNETYVGDFIYPIPLRDRAWRLAILGRAADTDLYVRNAVVWGEQRYIVPPESSVR